MYLQGIDVAATPENFFFASEQRAYGLVYMPKGVFLDADTAINKEEEVKKDDLDEDDEF